MIESKKKIQKKNDVMFRIDAAPEGELDSW